jgi:hypothetical protein
MKMIRTMLDHVEKAQSSALQQVENLQHEAASVNVGGK